ncbi:MAG: MFS transporter [Gammaproteobacteria bacterium]|nr:MAG: MFS transporter [Gammaproteobacteria bacterium]TNE95054.1 MAG: MFS transporter [Gammaproteobacteria bacterium]
MMFIIAAITAMTLSGLVGLQLSPAPSFATLPIALMMLGTVVSTLPASLLMAKIGRRLGFMSGAFIGGIGGGLVSVAGIAIHSFTIFCIGNVLLGLYQGFAMYYRFAAVDVASPAFRSRAISLVLTGGVAAAFLGPWNASALIDLLDGAHMAGPYLVVAIQAVSVMMLLSLLRVPYSGEPHHETYARPLKVIIRQSNFIVALISASIGYAIMILLMSATPLAMRAHGYSMEEVAFIMQWHVLGMFVPSFFTGNLIARFGVGLVLLLGSLILAGATIIADAGHTLNHYLLSLILLGVGWNFLFVGGTSLLSTTHTEEERGKVQGVNDFVIFSLVAFGSLLSGQLLHLLGWEKLNLSLLPFILVVALLGLWLSLVQRGRVVA